MSTEEPLEEEDSEKSTSCFGEFGSFLGGLTKSCVGLNKKGLIIPLDQQIDYSNQTCWIKSYPSQPGSFIPKNTPENFLPYTHPNKAQADVFYVHSTCLMGLFTSKKRYNMNVNEQCEFFQPYETVRETASIFNNVGAIYAPKHI